MTRARATILGLSLAVMLVAAACGSDDASTTGSPTVAQTTNEHGMTEHEHEHMYENEATAKPLPTLADGTIDPDRIDLSGVDGVTPEQQARAEDLLRRSVLTLPKWSDVATAEADGFRSIGDSITGEEHYLHWDWINDDVILDPSQPESLVYRVNGDGSRSLEAAMFILPDSYTLDNVPDVGGDLVQFHIHNDLCFTFSAAPQVAGFTDANGDCHPPLVEFNHNPMIHVWIVSNPCGPFAALQGAGAGQIKPGEERACDRAHGEELTL